jgi:hypothetical protein
MDLDKATNTVEKADGFFTKLNGFIRKHPIWFSLLVLVGLGYWISTWDLSDVEEEVPGEVVEEAKPTKPTLDKATWILDKKGHRKGDTVYIDYWSDGVIDKYYTDGENYSEEEDI